jgi:branched-chain amino acid transport system permease protein
LGVLFVVIVMYAPGGLAGLVMMHEPIWKVNPRLLRRMVAPYAAAIGATFVALIGALGIAEMVYYRSTKQLDSGTEFDLYGFHIDTVDILPWVVCAVIGAAGVWACRRTYPRAADSWSDAIEEVRARVVG